MNSGSNVFGQGNRANATIGRAIKLILTNIGRAIPGVTDKATLGHPGKYTYCIAENEEQSPWDPLHVERGFTREQSAVTVFGREAPHNINNQASQNAFDLAFTIADTMATLRMRHQRVRNTWRATTRSRPWARARRCLRCEGDGSFMRQVYAGARLEYLLARSRVFRSGQALFPKEASHGLESGPR